MPNLFSNIPTNLPDEWFQTLAEAGGTQIERIVSRGHTTPTDEWLDQERDEWVVLLTGAATLLIDRGEQVETITLKPGDHLSIPAQQRHRIQATAEDQDTVWLAVHYGPAST